MAGAVTRLLFTSVAGLALGYLHPKQREDHDKEEDEYEQVGELGEHADERPHDLVEPVPYSHQAQDPARERTAAVNGDCSF